MPGPNLLGGRFPGRLNLSFWAARSEKLLAHTKTRYAHTRAASTRQSRSAAQIRTRRYAPDARASPLIPPPHTPPHRRPGPRPRLSHPPAHFGAHQWSSISRRTRSSSAEAQRAVRSAAQACACGKQGRRGRLAGAYLPMSISTDGSMSRGWPGGRGGRARSGAGVSKLEGGLAEASGRLLLTWVCASCRAESTSTSERGGSHGTSDSGQTTQRTCQG